MFGQFISRLPQSNAPLRIDMSIMIACAYFLSAQLSGLLITPPIYAAPLSPAAGVALGCLLLWGSRYWLGVLVGATVSSIVQLFDATHGSINLSMLMLATVIGSGAALQAVLATKLIRRYVEFPTMLMRERDVLGFFILGGPIAHLLSATSGTLALSFAGVIPLSSAATTWWTWWIGDSIGALLCAPLVIMWLRDDAAWTRRRTIVTMPFAATLAAIALFFLYNSHTDWHRLQLRFAEDNSELSNAIAQRADRDIELLNAVSALLVADEHVDRATFSKFTQSMLARHSELQSLQWIPADDTSAALPANLSLPNKEFQAALAQSVQRKSLVMTSPFAANESKKSKNILLAQSVFSSNDQLLGEVTAALNVSRLVANALHDQSIASLVHLQIDDVTAGMQPANVFVPPLAPSDSLGQHFLYDASLQQVIALPLADHKWQLQFTPTLDYFSARRVQSNWLELAGALLVTSLIGIGALLITGRARSIETLVGLRTTELAQINEKLAEEICDHLSTEHMLEKERELLKAVLDNLHEGILVLDENGRMQMANDSAHGMLLAITGVETDSIPTPRPFRMYTPDGNTELSRDQLPHISALRGKTVRDFELVLQTPGREALVVIVNAQPLRTTDGKQHGAIIAMRDITDTKKIERMKAEFVATVSHELRTPITSIRGSLGLIAGGVAGQLTEKTLHLVQIALRNSDRLALLINDLLDMEKMESGKMNFDLRYESLPQLVEQAIEANNGYAQNLDVSLVLKQPVAAAFVNVDPLRLVQVMSNLLSNAAKFSPAKSQVQISVLAGKLLRSKSVRVEVKDDGPGIPQEFRSRIFQKFSQADSSDARAKSGTGLGLAICKIIIEQMDGLVGYESLPGKGSTFYFELPMMKVDVSNDKHVKDARELNPAATFK